MVAPLLSPQPTTVPVNDAATPLTMKTLEFKLDLTVAQRRRIESWMDKMRWIHNSALAAIASFNSYNVYHKPDKRTYAASPIATFWRGQVYPTCPVKHQLDQFDPVAYGEALANPRDKKGTLVPLQAWQGEVPLKNLSYQSLARRFTKEAHPVMLADVPSTFVRGRVERVALSWQAFMKGNASPPKFKGARNPINTLIDPDSKKTRVDGDRVFIPRLGAIKVKGFSKRWPQGVPFCPLKIIRAADGWYLQVTGAVGRPIRAKANGVVVGVDPGSVRHHTRDDGGFVAPPRFLARSQKRLKKLQRKLSRQWRTMATPIYAKEGGRLLRWELNWRVDERTGRKIPPSNQQKTKAAIAKVHAKIARQRRAFNHFHSSRMVGMAEVISVEDLALQNVTRAVKKGQAGVQNGRKRKAGLNRNLLDNAIGQFYGMMEMKAAAAGRAVVRVKPHYTSQACNRCGYVSPDNRRSQSRFICQHCGHTDNADRNAAKNIRAIALAGTDHLEVVDGFATTLAQRPKP